MVVVKVAFSLKSVKMQRGNDEKLCVQWNNFGDNIRSSFEELREDKDFTDVTLACEDGQQFAAHKMVLIASSPFFLNLLRKNKHSHPLIYMRGVKSEVLTAIVDFLYRGEANVYQENLDSFLALAAELQLKGLEDNQSKENDEINPKNNTKEDKIPTDPSQRVKPTPKTSPPQDVAKREYPDERKTFVPSKDTAIVLSDYANDADLKNLDETVKSMMIISENKVAGGKQGWAKICTACGKEGHVSTIMNHIETFHLSGLQIPCNICGKVAKSRQSLKMHKGQIHRNGQNTALVQ